MNTTTVSSTLPPRVYIRTTVYDIRVGDIIRKEYDTPSDIFPVRALEYIALRDKDGRGDHNDGRYYLIKRAPVPLPTEPGLYLDRDDDVWKIGPGTRLYLLWSQTSNKALMDGVDQHAPFRRLTVEVEP